MGKLDGKVALVTGGLSGIGRATAALFADERAHVVLFDVRGDSRDAGAAGDEIARVLPGAASSFRATCARPTTSTAPFAPLSSASAAIVNVAPLTNRAISPGRASSSTAAGTCNDAYPPVGMALTLENELVVSAGVEPTWRLLLDLERVSRCLPGVAVERGGEDGQLLGTMRVKLGPIAMTYKGTARLDEVDEAARIAVIAVEGKETKGQGSASARIRSTLAAESASTRVRVETELNVTGRPAQFGRGIMQDVAAKMMAEFADCLSRTLAETPVDAAPAPGLDLASAVGGVVAGRLRRLLQRLFGRRS